MILQVIHQLGPWSWWVLGLILLALEIVVPGNVFVWFGVGALITGVLALIADVGWQVELIVFVVLAVVLVIVGRRIFARAVQPGEQPFLNDRAHRLVGSTYMLVRADRRWPWAGQGRRHQLADHRPRPAVGHAGEGGRCRRRRAQGGEGGLGRPSTPDLQVRRPSRFPASAGCLIFAGRLVSFQVRHFD